MYDVYTFDLFDTLLIPLWLDFRHLYSLEERLLGLKGFTNARLEAERLYVGTNKFRLHNILRYALQRAVYTGGRNKGKRTAIDVSSVVELEYDLLKSFLRLNSETARVLQGLLRSQRAVFVITDTFYPADFLARLLGEFNIKIPANLILSSADIGIFKNGGKLYEYFWLKFLPERLGVQLTGERSDSNRGAPLPTDGDQLGGGVYRKSKGLRQLQWVHFEDVYSLDNGIYKIPRKVNSISGFKLYKVPTIKDVLKMWFYINRNTAGLCPFCGDRAADTPLLYSYSLSWAAYRVLGIIQGGLRKQKAQDIEAFNLGIVCTTDILEQKFWDIITPPRRYFEAYALLMGLPSYAGLIWFTGHVLNSNSKLVLLSRDGYNLLGIWRRLEQNGLLPSVVFNLVGTNKPRTSTSIGKYRSPMPDSNAGLPCRPAYLYASRSYLVGLYCALLDEYKAFKELMSEATIWEGKNRLEVDQLWDYFKKQVPLYHRYLIEALYGDGAAIDQHLSTTMAPIKLGDTKPQSVQHDSLVLFDVGWRGTVPRVLSTLLSKLGISPTKQDILALQVGYFNPSVTAERLNTGNIPIYAMLDLQGINRLKKITGYSRGDSISSVLWLVEVLFSAPYGRFKGFKPISDNEKKVAPVFEDVPQSVVEVNKIIHCVLVEGVTSFLGDIAKMPRNVVEILVDEVVTPQNAHLRSYLFLPFLLVFRSYGYGHLKGLSTLSIEVGNRAELKPFVVTVTPQEFNKLSSRELMRLAESSLWRGALLVEGVAETEFRKMLQQKGVVPSRRDWMLYSLVRVATMVSRTLTWYKVRMAFRNPRLVVRWLRRVLG